MFNKSPLFNRKDAVSQRESALSESSNTDLGLMGNGKPYVRTINTMKEKESVSSTHNEASPPPVAPTAVTKENAAPATPKEDQAKKEKVGANVSDTGMGARLIVGPDVKLKGAQILDCDTLVVEGYVEATMDSRVIRVAENGSFSGKVSVDVAEIHGTFEGELTARLQLIIHSTARVKGSIRYGRLMADEGCELCGDVDVLSRSHKDKPESQTPSSGLVSSI